MVTLIYHLLIFFATQKPLVRAVLTFFSKPCVHGNDLLSPHTNPVLLPANAVYTELVWGYHRPWRA